MQFRGCRCELSGSCVTAPRAVLVFFKICKSGAFVTALEAVEKLMEYLITLGGSNMSKSFLIRHVLAQISALADQLWQAFQ
ncbi:hypothetical protein INR49_018038, partial [Caranx melampygus]